MIGERLSSTFRIGPSSPFQSELIRNYGSYSWWNSLDGSSAHRKAADYKNNINTVKTQRHPSLEWDSNPTIPVFEREKTRWPRGHCTQKRLYHFNKTVGIQAGIRKEISELRTKSKSYNCIIIYLSYAIINNNLFPEILRLISCKSFSP
jgi:hypothetical protein